MAVATLSDVVDACLVAILSSILSTSPTDMALIRRVRSVPSPSAITTGSDERERERERQGREQRISWYT